MSISLDAQIGYRVSELRGLASVKSAAAAERCGLSRSDYERSERGDRRFSAFELYSLSLLFDVEMAEFFTGLVDSFETDGHQSRKVRDEPKWRPER